MLAFAVYHDHKLLAQWPDTVHSRAYCLFLADADDRPREHDFDVDYGRLAVYCEAGVQRRLFIRYAVQGFGDPVLRTRILESGPTLHNLAVELALGRLELLDDLLARAQQAGEAPSRPIWDEIARAKAMTQQATELDAAGARDAAGALADAALAISVPVGEALALELARTRLTVRARRGGLRGFHLGCAGFAFDAQQQRGQRFLEAFNYATLPFYLSGMEPTPGQVEHTRVRAVAEELHARGLVLKGHPLVWTYAMCLPPHHQGMDFDECCRVFAARIRRDVPPFRDIVGYWDIINEAHDTPWANSLAFTSAQMVELTALAARETRAAAPNAKLVINVCLPFAEYAAGAPGRATTLEYLRACLAAGVDFDVIGIQFYYGSGLLQYCWDMLEISRILDAYAALGKEIHITELGTPSAMGPDPNAMIREGNEVGLWHGAWSEDTQAEWVEQFYTLCMANPAITALTWWSFSDAEPVFWPHSGLLNANDEPKAAFLRLLTLRQMIEDGVALSENDGD